MTQHRKSLKRYEIPNHARYLTFSCYKRQPFLAGPDTRSRLADQIRLARQRLGFRLFAWVIMPEHVHMLVGPHLPEQTVPDILQAIKRPFAARELKR